MEYNATNMGAATKKLLKHGFFTHTFNSSSDDLNNQNNVELLLQNLKKNNLNLKVKYV